jgi:hypothetical protein
VLTNFVLTDLLWNPDLPPQWYLLPLTLHCLIGITAAIVAYQKGLNLKRWIVIGIIGGTPALIAAIAAKPRV